MPHNPTEIASLTVTILLPLPPSLDKDDRGPGSQRGAAREESEALRLHRAQAAAHENSPSQSYSS